MVSLVASLISCDDNFGRGFDYVGTTKGFNYNASFYHCLMLQLLIIEVFDFLHIMVSNFGSWFNKQTCFDYFSTLMKTDVSNFISLGTMSLKMAQRWVKPAIVVNRRKCLFGCSLCTLHINPRSYQFYYLKGFSELPKMVNILRWWSEPRLILEFPMFMKFGPWLLQTQAGDI